MITAWKQKLKKAIRLPEFWLCIIVIVGSIVRLAALDRFPMGLHQDEAYSAYNAYSVLHYGMDSYGYTRPVYYTVWGSGMSVLYSYLTMPFLALFGVSAITIRLPQAILGCISILAAYGLGKELFDKRFGILFAGLLAINPWHIQQSRFGLDANLAVPMLLFAIYFLCRYLNGKRKSIWLASFFFGLTLYCYAITWPLIPAILILCLAMYYKRIKWDKHLLGAVCLLFVMALPLLLFLAINYGMIPEIKTGLFSIPKLPQIRSDEFSLGKLKQGFFWLIAMLWAQHDDNWWITDANVGAYYYVSTPFIMIGLFFHLKTLWKCIRKREALPLHFIMAIWFAAMFLMGCSIDFAKYYKVNCIHIPIIFYCLYGIVNLWKLLKVRWIQIATVVVYVLFFGYFLYSQMTFTVNYEEYGNPLVSHMLWYKYEDAVDYAESITDGDISIIGLNYANLMLYKEMSPYEYMERVEYDGDNEAFRTVSAIGRYRFNYLPGEDTENVVFVFPYSFEDIFKEKGYTIVRTTECYAVAYQ